VLSLVRLSLDKHWFSDLAGGFSVGLAYLLVAIWLIEVVFGRSPSPPPDRAEESVLAPGPRDTDRA